jgi:hypothetical protein
MCAKCDCALHLTEEVFELKIVQAQIFEGRLQHYDVLADDGDYLYRPHFFEFGCWENLEEELTELHEDVPGMSDAQGIIECDICGSDVRAWETVGLVRFGELHCSQRSPNGMSVLFENMGHEKHICVGCLYHLDHDEEYWDGHIDVIPGVSACTDGVYERCWRSGSCREGNCRRWRKP